MWQEMVHRKQLTSISMILAEHVRHHSPLSTTVHVTTCLAQNFVTNVLGPHPAMVLNRHRQARLDMVRWRRLAGTRPFFYRNGLATFLVKKGHTQVSLWWWFHTAFQWYWKNDHRFHCSFMRKFKMVRFGKITVMVIADVHQTERPNHVVGETKEVDTEPDVARYGRWTNQILPYVTREKAATPHWRCLPDSQRGGPYI